MKRIKLYIKKRIRNFLGIETIDAYLVKLKKRGLRVGNNFNMQKNVILDDTHCWLICIGDNVTLAPGVHILCHDTSTKQYLNYTKIGSVKIGDNVFIGANTTIMPSVSIGNNVIIAAGSIVTKDVEEGKVIAGIPAKVIDLSGNYLLKNKKHLANTLCYDESYTMRGNITDEKKQQMITEIESSKNKNAYII